VWGTGWKHTCSGKRRLVRGTQKGRTVRPTLSVGVSPVLVAALFVVVAPLGPDAGVGSGGRAEYDSVAPRFGASAVVVPDAEYAEVEWNAGIPGQRVYEYDPWVEPTGDDSAAGFGASVSVEGDVAVVGSPGSDLEGSNHGAVFVYERVGGSWVRTAVLLPSDIVERHDSVRFPRFGHDVAVSNGRVFVAAPGQDAGCNVDVGAVYIFEKVGSAWVQTERLWRNGNDDTAFCDDAIYTGISTDGMSTDDYFGISIAVSGNTLVVSSKNRDWHGGFNCRNFYHYQWWEEGGAYHVFERGPSGWSKTAKFQPEGEWTAWSAAIDGDILALTSGGWEVETVASAADCVANDPPDQSVRLYDRVGDVWVEQQKLTLGTGGYCCSFFETELGNDWALVATEIDSKERVRVLRRSAGEWAVTQDLEPPDESNTQFGQGLALDGSHALVGAPWYAGQGGAVFGYELIGGQWQLQGQLGILSPEFWLPSGSAQLSLFGSDVALSGATALIGGEWDVVYREELNVTPGSGYLFELPTGQWSPPPGAEDPGPGSGTFWDDDGSVFETDIEWMAAAGITKGCNPPTNDQFCPDSVVTRGQMAAFLVRALGYTEDGGGNLFIDDDASIFEADIDRLGTAAVTRGCNPPINDQYCPNANVTRGQMAAFLVRALGYTDNGDGNLFVDDDGSVFEADIDRLGTAAVTRGCNPPTNDMYCPDSFVTRGQMAAFLHRALG